MDEIDIAHEQEEWFRDMALKQRKPVPEHDGYCLNCGDPSRGAYCDGDCRNEAELFERARKRNGF